MKKDAKNLEDLASDKPTIIYLTGQPGSGKTTLGKYLQMQLAQQGKCAVEVGSDKIATYHKYYNELLKLLPNECYSLSREFVNPAKPVIFNKLIANKLNILRECSLTKGEKDYNGMQKFIDSGYEVDINIMAVDKYESFLACTERDIKLMELGFDPRPVARANHDRMYSPLLQELIEIQKRGLSTRISVFTRGVSLPFIRAWLGLLEIINIKMHMKQLFLNELKKEKSYSKNLRNIFKEFQMLSSQLV